MMHCSYMVVAFSETFYDLFAPICASVVDEYDLIFPYQRAHVVCYLLYQSGQISSLIEDGEDNTKP